eukprot:gene10995-11149_t
MALASFIPPLALSGLLSSSVLPTAFYGMKVFSRSSSYLHLTAPKPMKQEDAVTQTQDNQAIFQHTFGPLAHELTRQAGGFEGERRWPLNTHQPATLIGMQLSQPTWPTSSCRVRHHSIVPKSVVPIISSSVIAQTQHTAAGLLDDVSVSQLEKPNMLQLWVSKVKPRMKGYSRKLALRQLNRRVIARVARRFTIGIPVLGFYFVSKLMVKDLVRVRAEYASGDYNVAALFATALAADILDLAAQVTVISGLAHNHLGAGLASAAALLVAADKASLVTAALSFSCGLSGELLSLKHAGDDDAKSL